MSEREVTAWFKRFWAAGEADSVSALDALEASLGVRLPAVLREAYESTWLRDSAQMHLRTLAELELDGDVLIFMDEQQAGSGWGCRISAGDDPPALTTMDYENGDWEEEGLSVSALLKLFWLVNRPYEAPCTDQLSPPGPELLRRGWDEYVFPMRDGPVALWSRGSAVSDGNAIGARTRAELEKELIELGRSEPFEILG